MGVVLYYLGSDDKKEKILYLFCLESILSEYFTSTIG